MSGEANEKWVVVDPLLSGSEEGHSQTMARGLVESGVAGEIWGCSEVAHPRILCVFAKPWPKNPGGTGPVFRLKWAWVVALSQIRCFAALWPRRKDPRNWVFLNGRNIYILAMVLIAAFRRNREHAVWFFDPANRFYKLTGAVMRLFRISNVRFYTETPSMAEEYSRLLGQVCAYDAFPVLMRPLGDPPQKPAVVAVLGPPRQEKGFDLLPGAIEALAAEREAGEVAFVIQCAPRWEPELVDAAIARLEGLPGVRLIKEQLSAGAYEQTLDASHAVWVPYRAANYARRSSWVAIEGMVAGKVVLMTSGIPACEMVEARGAGLFFGDGDTTSMVAAIRRLLMEPALHREAQAKAQAFRDNGFWNPFSRQGHA